MSNGSARVSGQCVRSRRMARKVQYEGVYARDASILISFNWEGRRHRERIAMPPTAATLRAASRARHDIVKAIAVGSFSVDDFARYFPHSKFLKSNVNPVGSTVACIAETWLTIAGQRLAETTVKEYRNTINKHLLPRFGHREIASIRFEELLLHLASKNLRNARTFNNVLTPIRAVWAYAVKTGKAPVDILAQMPTRKHQKAKPDPLDLHEIDLVLRHLATLNDDQWLNYFTFALFTGLRPSELIALKWEDVDFDRKQVLVERARVRGIDKDAKTHRSRNVDLQSRALSALTRQMKHTFLAGGFVFQNPRTNERLFDTGPPVQDGWRPTLRAVGLRGRDAKQTRHTFATMCLHAGMNPAYVARQMGHSDARMFFEVYAKWIDGQANELEISKLDALVGTSDMAPL
ncbi:site-specific integrase [Oxalobacteraceae bacterium OM1]|nr:site-specific integrase [Oxalobacteraceae bacterium OM1]